MNITRNKFENNTATLYGGAIYYDYNRPFFSNNTFINNQASYGSDVGSYPVKIVLRGGSTDQISIINVGSGIRYENDLTLALVDYDDQEMVSNNQDLIKINPLNSSGSFILGTNFGQLTNGVTTFDNLIFISQPGTTNVKYIASSSSIDTDKIQSVFGRQISDNQIDVSFRWCKPGEIYDKVDKCIK